MTTIQSAPEKSDVLEETIKLRADENWTLAATLFSPARSASLEAPVILISGAAAVPHGFYSAFARHLVINGAAAVLTYDYRGMGASSGDHSKWPELRMKHWALLDMPAAMDFLSMRFPNHPLCGLGHSYGGQALGLLEHSQKFSRYATVATISGYWRLLDEPFGVWFKTQIVGTIIAKLLGRIPKWVGLGDEMPGRIFLDWARWVGNEAYFFDDPDLPQTERYANVTLPLLSIGLEDDVWGTPQAVDGVMKNYVNAQLHQHWIKPTQSGKIGHLGYFRQRHKQDHWSVVTDFLLREKLPKT